MIYAQVAGWIVAYVLVGIVVVGCGYSCDDDCMRRTREQARSESLLDCLFVVVWPLVVITAIAHAAAEFIKKHARVDWLISDAVHVIGHKSRERGDDARRAATKCAVCDRLVCTCLDGESEDTNDDVDFARKHGWNR